MDSSLAELAELADPDAGPAPTHGAALLGEHPAMRLVLERIDQAAETDANVLIRGEEGTGTEVVAQLVHATSARRAGSFVAVTPRGLAEPGACAEFFGRGSAVLAAQGGTLFLEEVGFFPKALQARLLRLVHDREILPDGTADPLPVDVRVIASTSRDLEQRSREGAFLAELFYELDVVPIEVPPLRARREDIPRLADHFRRALNAREGLGVPPFSPEVTAGLAARSWPGNLRELQDTVGRFARAAVDREVTVDDLAKASRPDAADLDFGGLELPASGVDLRLFLTRLEHRLIGQALQRTGGNKNRAAELLRINRTTLVEKLRRRNVA